MDEFEVIERYFGGRGWYQPPAMVLGPGDDCAIVQPPAGAEICVSTDTLVAGVHFPAGAPGEVVAHRVFAATLSDVAAMGAEPLALTLALTMPGVNHEFLEAYASRLKLLTTEYRTPLVGGNLSRGPLSVTGQVIGYAPAGAAVRRSGALAGDAIVVTGQPGAAAAGLAAALDRLDVTAHLQAPYLFPTARIAEGLKARQWAHALIDITDGLLADVTHIAKASGVGLRIDVASLPLAQGVTPALALTGGDDYELCMAAPKQVLAELDEQWTVIGEFVPASEGIRCIDAQGQELNFEQTGYLHF